MSVRDGLLAILSLGDAYGLQLHSELLGRAPHRERINVGQIYGTLERLTRNGLTASAGSTEDGLPEYRLTDEGLAAARRWMTTAQTTPLPEWTEMLDQILITSTISAADTFQLVAQYRAWWSADLENHRALARDESLSHDRHLAHLAHEALGIAALAWLGSVSASIAEHDTARGLSTSRPRRGRRPSRAGASRPA